MDQRLQANTNQPLLSVAAQRIAFIQACWHREIVDRGRDSFVAAIERLGGQSDRVDLFEVPGSFEIPLLARRLARSGKYGAIVGCGLVVDGGIYRHEFVAHAVIDALMQVQLETDVPVLSMVLTPKHFHDHEEHRRFFREHFVVKGEEAASACLRTLATLARLSA
jgi:6,7-dimethyl-8-ribityllumazine synthase